MNHNDWVNPLPEHVSTFEDIAELYGVPIAKDCYALTPDGSLAILRQPPAKSGEIHFTSNRRFGFQDGSAWTDLLYHQDRAHVTELTYLDNDGNVIWSPPNPAEKAAPYDGDEYFKWPHGTEALPFRLAEEEILLTVNIPEKFVCGTFDKRPADE